LQKLSGLAVNGETPVAAFVGPLTEERGADAFIAAAPELVKAGMQVIIASDMTSPLKKSADALAKKFPQQVCVTVGFDEEYLHQLMAGASVLVKPSRHEVSGQFQRIALTYGTIPVVRVVGGIAEGLTDVDEKKNTGNAFLMKKGDSADIVKTLQRVATLHASHEVWNGIVARAMTSPVGWTASAQSYDEFYRTLVKESK
jgi:starch synthase